MKHQRVKVGMSTFSSEKTQKQSEYIIIVNIILKENLIPGYESISWVHTHMTTGTYRLKTGFCIQYA